MYDEKREYEKRIQDSPLFQLDRQKQANAYKRESLKLIENLYSYLMTLNARKYESFGMEIVDTAKRCIQNYDPQKGDFLHYFNSSWKQAYGHAVGEELVKETFRGLRFTEADRRNFRKYMRYVQSTGTDLDSDEFYQRTADAMGLSEEEVRELRKMADSRPVSGISVTEDGEEFSLLDQIDSGKYTDVGLGEKENAAELLEVIQTVFDQLQDRQKTMMAKLLTSKIALLVNEDPELTAVFKEKTYYDETIYEECIRNKAAVQAKEISERLGVREASTSRSWKHFKEKLNGKVKS